MSTRVFAHECVIACHVFKMAERNNDSSDAESEQFEVEDTDVPSCKRIKTTHVGAAKYRSKFKSEWGHKYPVKAVKNDLYSFHCIRTSSVTTRELQT